jgi:hypothetical protein
VELLLGKLPHREDGEGDGKITLRSILRKSLCWWEVVELAQYCVH